MEDATPVGRDAPRDLWVAKAVGGGEGGKAEWADLDRPPWLDDASGESTLLKRRLGFLNQGNFGCVAKAFLRPQDDGSRSECASVQQR